jgi:hypothetical protein
VDWGVFRVRVYPAPEKTLSLDAPPKKNQLKISKFGPKWHLIKYIFGRHSSFSQICSKIYFWLESGKVGLKKYLFKVGMLSKMFQSSFLEVFAWI